MGRRLRGWSAGELDLPLLRYSALLLVVSALGGFVSVTLSNPSSVPVTTIGPTPTEDAMEITADGLGDVKIGMLFRDAIDQAGLTVLRDDDSCGTAGDPKTGGSVIAQHGLVVVVSVSEPGIPTDKGIQVGDATADVFEVYDPTSQVGSQVIVADGENELVIGIYDSIVTYIWARKTGASVGC